MGTPGKITDEEHAERRIRELGWLSVVRLHLRRLEIRSEEDVDAVLRLPVGHERLSSEDSSTKARWRAR